MSTKTHFDYIIIGNGLAGLQLALAFSKDAFFKNKQIALIDPSPKTENDKTWSFWEKGQDSWDFLVSKSWNKAFFYSKNIKLELPLEDYTYKSIQAIDFYNWSINELKKNTAFHFISDTVNSLKETESVQAIGEVSTYSAHHVFDSRIPKDFYSKTSKHTLIHQHFKGLVIETNKPCFQTNAFTMMDYRYQYKNTTSFMYVLPFSETKALVEYTFFTPELVDDNVYDNTIDTYIKHELKIDNYKIVETEIGNIPMTDFNFGKHNTQNITKIGTGGGWVKGSTGYSFKHTEKHVLKIIENIKSNKLPSCDLFQKKYKFYDKIFLNVLKNNNEKGVWIFERFYSKNKMYNMFRFLDEDTSFKEDLAIMHSLFSLTFIKAFFKILFRR